MNTKKLLLTLLLLLCAGSAYAECALYVDDFELRQDELGLEIAVPVKAHFSARLNAWQVDVTLPWGLQAVDATAGADLTVSYCDGQGVPRQKQAYFYGMGSNNRVIAFFTDYGYWQDPAGEDPASWTPYGQIKWESGDYDEMIVLHLVADPDFKGGNIMFNTLVSSTQDRRGGTTLENGDENVHFTRVCHVSVEGIPSSIDSIEAAAPVINPIVCDDYVYVRIDWPVSTGNHVYTGQYIYTRGDEDAEYEVEAYVEANHPFAESAHARQTIEVPAKGEPGSEPQLADPYIVLIDAHGIEHKYALACFDNEYYFMMRTRPKMWGENMPFYFMANGKRYGPDTDMQEPLMMDDPAEELSNPLVEGENMWCVPTQSESNGDYGYTFELRFINDEITMLILQGVFTEEETVEQTQAPIVYGWDLRAGECDGLSQTHYFVEMTPAEPSTIYYRVHKGSPGSEAADEWSAWSEYKNVLDFNEAGCYCIEAFAVADDKIPSEELQYWFVLEVTISVNEVNGDKAVACVRYFNLAGQEMPQADGMTIVVTTYTDGTTSVVKVMK